MDLFVDAIDSKILPSEKYQQLLKSKKKRKTNNENNNNKSIKNQESIKSEVSQKSLDNSPNDVDVSPSETQSPNDEVATPFLNTLIDTCTVLVRTCNHIYSEKQKESVDENEFLHKVTDINSKCQSIIDNIKEIIKKVAPDHIYNDNTNHFEILFDEIEYGLKNHNKINYPKLATKLDAVLTSELDKNNNEDNMDTDSKGDGDNKEKDNRGDKEEERDEEDNSSQSSNTNDDLNCSFGLDIGNVSKSKLRKELAKYENTLLDTYSIDINVKNYTFRFRPQDKWKDSFDNFTDRFHNTDNLVKYNKIEPQIKFTKQHKQIKFFEKNFVPKIYPKLDFLTFCEKDHLVQTHIYAQELNSLVWSEEKSNSTHTGYNLLGGDGNLFKITENKYNTNVKYKVITKRKEFDEMIEEIEKHTIMSIDVEHHSKDTYRGFTCLIQISTLEDDFIVDPLNMFTYINKLNIVTTDPSILKVMHSASNDVIWLQRDFGVYIVNLFDTREAAKVLSISEQSFASLVKKYFDIKLNKVYQLSDWSKRPLSEEMLNYACYDSHFLIPLYVCLKNEILSKSDSKIRLIQVMKNSRDICLKKYVDRGAELCQKFRSICKRNKIKKESLDFVSYNFFLNLLAFRNFAARKFDTSENLIVKDYQIYIIVRNLKGGYYHMINTMNSHLQSIKFEIPNLIKIKNSIEMVYNKLNKVDLILVRPRSIQFIVNSLNEENLDKLKSEEFEKLLVDFSIIFHQFSLI